MGFRSSKLRCQRGITMKKTSQISGFYKLTPKERIKQVKDFADLTDQEVKILQSTGALEMELADRKVKAQMKRANKSGAEQVIIRGDTELEKGIFVLKDMKESTQQEVELPELMELL